MKRFTDEFAVLFTGPPRPAPGPHFRWQLFSWKKKKMKKKNKNNRKDKFRPSLHRLSDVKSQPFHLDKPRLRAICEKLWQLFGATWSVTEYSCICVDRVGLKTLTGGRGAFLFFCVFRAFRHKEAVHLGLSLAPGESARPL